MLHLVSKDNNKAVRRQTIKDKGSQSFENKMLTYMCENKRILNLHEQKFDELIVLDPGKHICVSSQHKCFSEKYGGSSRATGLVYPESI